MLNVAAWGDSLTSDYAATLETLMPERTIHRGGIGGQTSTEIAARQGAVVPLMTIAGGTILATGGVAITNQSVQMQNVNGPNVVRGTLGGVYGQVTRAVDGTYTFTRSNAGTAVSVGADEPFIVDTFGRRSWATVFWYGRNNFADPTTVLGDLVASVAFLEPGNDHFVVLPVLNSGTEPIGSASYNAIQQLNASIAAAFPGKFLDIRAQLVAAYDRNQPQDVIDNANDVPPTSLRRDALHMNAAGKLVLAGMIKDYIEQQGW